MKRFSTGIFAVLMAIGFAAFTTPQKAHFKATTYTYKFIGSLASDENLATNYLQENTVPAGCNDNIPQMVCFIETSYAPDGNGNPQFPSGTTDVRNDEDVEIQHWQPEP